MERSKVLQTRKLKRVQHHQTSFTRNVKGTSLSEKEPQLEHENYERKKLISKGKYTVKIVNQPHTKLVRRLKDESNKTIYIHNK